MKPVSLWVTTIAFPFFLATSAIADPASYITEMHRRGYSSIPDSDLIKVGWFACDRTPTEAYDDLMAQMQQAGIENAETTVHAVVQSSFDKLCIIQNDLNISISLKEGWIPLSLSPSLHGETIASVQGGRRVVVESISGRWALIYLSDIQREGWVHISDIQSIEQ